MRQASLATKIGTTAELRPGTPDVIVASEPTLGATLRTKGRFYFLCEVARQHGNVGGDIAREVADLARQEYYYDLSAGIEVSLRKALRQANRRAAQRLRDQRGRVVLHAACAVVVNNELYAARIGAAQVFLVRRARLFLPGDEPGELADFVHRTTTREAESLGGVADLLPDVWRQSIEAGDTLILASGALVDGLGAEALKNAAITLHPRAAAEHINNRAVADGVIGSAAAIFIEVTAASAAAGRVLPEPDSTEASEVVIAETIRSRVESVWRRRPKVAEAIGQAAVPAAKAVGKTVAVGFELMPRRAPPLPHRPNTARERSRRQRRVASLLAVLLLVVAGGIGLVALRDYQANRVTGDYALAILGIESDISAAQRFADRTPPDNVSAREKIDHARVALDEAARSPAADPARIATLREQVATLDDRITGVVADLARFAPGAKPTAIVGNVNGLFVADPGAGRLWRVFGDPTQVAAVLTKGLVGVGAPRLVAYLGEVVYSIDDQKRVWRAEGTGVADVTPQDSGATWKSADAFAVFAANLYILDATTGQVWKHESFPGTSFLGGTAYLTEPIPAGVARAIAIDQDIWIVTTQGDILRYRRLTTSFTASRVDFVPRWNGPAVKPTAVQAIDVQRAVYFLDGPNKLVVQMNRDGGEMARYPLAPNLTEPSAFYVSEGLRTIFTIHGSKVVATELRA